MVWQYTGALVPYWQDLVFSILRQRLRNAQVTKASQTRLFHGACRYRSCVMIYWVMLAWLPQATVATPPPTVQPTDWKSTMCASEEQFGYTVNGWYFGHTNGGGGKANQCEQLCRADPQCNMYMTRDSGGACYLSEATALRVKPNNCCTDHHAYIFVACPTPAPTPPTAAPTSMPTEAPTVSPTAYPTVAPTESPTPAPTPAPTSDPTETPTPAPTSSPTGAPSPAPTPGPTQAPTAAPTQAPTQVPTLAPTPNPTEAPTLAPTPEPSCWSERLDGIYIQQGHFQSQCYPTLEDAKSICEALSDCGAIATQSNYCGGQYRVSQGLPPTQLYYTTWRQYNLWAYILDRSCVPTPSPTNAACARPSGWCTHTNTVYEHKDCDNDTVADPFCSDGAFSGYIGSASGCSNGWPDGGCQAGCSRPSGWCAETDAVYDRKDCDGDGVADPFCSYGTSSGYRGSASGCYDTWPAGGCQETTNIVIEEARDVGFWGGSCTCPDGAVYQVGDNQDDCASLACVGGTASQCNNFTGNWSKRKVLCNVYGNAVIENSSGVGYWGGACTCPDGSVYQVGDYNDNCTSLACVGGAPGHCNSTSGVWSRREVYCATASNASTPVPYRALGSYVDTAVRALRYGPMEYGYRARACALACQDYAYFALQHGGWCSCENDFEQVSRYGPTSYCGELGGGYCNYVYFQPAQAWRSRYEYYPGSATSPSYCGNEYQDFHFSHLDAASCAAECDARPTCVKFILCTNAGADCCRLSTTCTSPRSSSVTWDGYIKVAPAPTPPTSEPTDAPTPQPTAAPSAQPTDVPTSPPTEAPTPQPTDAPTSQPTEVPTPPPTDAPTSQPSPQPTDVPTSQPTEVPTPAPTDAPTSRPSPQPTDVPTLQPTEAPTPHPTDDPTAQPTDAPTSEPTVACHCLSSGRLGACDGSGVPMVVYVDVLSSGLLTAAIAAMGYFNTMLKPGESPQLDITLISVGCKEQGCNEDAPTRLRQMVAACVPKGAPQLVVGWQSRTQDADTRMSLIDAIAPAPHVSVPQDGVEQSSLVGSEMSIVPSLQDLLRSVVRVLKIDLRASKALLWHCGDAEGLLRKEAAEQEAKEVGLQLTSIQVSVAEDTGVPPLPGTTRKTILDGLAALSRQANDSRHIDTLGHCGHWDVRNYIAMQDASFVGSSTWYSLDDPYVVLGDYYKTWLPYYTYLRSQYKDVMPFDGEVFVYRNATSNVETVISSMWVSLVEQGSTLANVLAGIGGAVPVEELSLEERYFFDAVLVALLALAQVGQSPSPKLVKAEFASIDFEGLTGRVAFDSRMRRIQSLSISQYELLNSRLHCLGLAKP